MKKSALLMAMAFFATVAFGPSKTLAEKKDQKPTAPKTEKVKTGKKETPKPAEKPADKAAVKATEKPDPKQEAKPAANATGPLKKDGTPDMRYKKNKEAAKPAGPTKKDGTPDMRYKANKK
ncbi:MAG: hypothetical protein HGB00_05560 [Chlorobiaceae bacterium]|nr:hypothetical protein [Chlorobiaceae bacterium]